MACKPSLRYAGVTLTSRRCLGALYSVNLKKYPCGLHPLAYLAAISLVGLTAILPCYMLELAMGTGFHLNTATATAVTIDVWINLLCTS